MGIESKITVDGTVFVISVQGAFDFSLLNDFRQSYIDRELNSAKVVIDLHRATTVDSSALGMLLNMQRYLNKDDMEISIINCNSNVEKIFKITHFNKKFIVEL